MTNLPRRPGQRLRIITEPDRLKGVLRQATIVDESRRGKRAEHSRQLASMAAVPAEQAQEGPDVLRTLARLLVHDGVEIDAGDAFCSDAQATPGREEREQRAEDQAAELRALWDDFEAGTSREARCAVALDRLQPLLQNYPTRGGARRLNGVSSEQSLRRMAPIRSGAPERWPVVELVVSEVCAAGYVSASA